MVSHGSKSETAAESISGNHSETSGEGLVVRELLGTSSSAAKVIATYHQKTINNSERKSYRIHSQSTVGDHGEGTVGPLVVELRDPVGGFVDGDG